MYLKDNNAMIKWRVGIPTCLGIPQEASQGTITLMNLLWAHICSSTLKILKFIFVNLPIVGWFLDV